jgi:predicted RNA-binding protein YlxR (DUF448 family)
LSGRQESEPGEGGGRTRMCAATRQVRPEADLIRFVAAPGGGVAADLRSRLPGRGVWVSLDRKIVAEAVRKNVFARALKEDVKPDAALADRLGAQFRKAALGRLGLARKAGQAVAGFAKVEAAIARDPLAAVLIAAEAAADGRRKIEQALRRRFGDQPFPPVFGAFTAEELGLATGRPSVIHAAVLQGPAGRSFVEAAIRFQRYEGVGDGPTHAGAGGPQGLANE